VLNGYWHVTLKDALGATVVSAVFLGQITQQGIDNDPIPEMFIRHGYSTTAGHALDVTGAIFQWEQPPTAWLHAYTGTYNGYSLDLAMVQVSGRFLC